MLYYSNFVHRDFISDHKVTSTANTLNLYLVYVDTYVHVIPLKYNIVLYKDKLLKSQKIVLLKKRSRYCTIL
jgi:hypothetical protein